MNDAFANPKTPVTGCCREAAYRLGAPPPREAAYRLPTRVGPAEVYSFIASNIAFTFCGGTLAKILCTC